MFVCFVIQVTAQKKCKSEEEKNLADLHVVSKCSVKSSSKKIDKANVLNVSVSASKKRYLKKNKAKKINSNLHKITRTISKEELKLAKIFGQVDEVPAFSECENLKGDDRMACFNAQMTEHINKYFYYPAEAVEKNIQGKIQVRFIIDANGNVSNIKALGRNKESKSLEEVAKYVVSKLPKFAPATKNGKPIATKYGFPIGFSLEE